MLQINKALIMSNISLLIVIVVAIGGIVGLAYYEQYQEDLQATSSQGQQSQSQQNPPPPRPASTSTPQTPRPPSQPAPAPSQPQIITASDADYQRLEQILPSNEVIQALPGEARILLSFFNFNSGTRTWERDYLIGKGTAVQVDSMPADLDMKMIMHSRNVPKLRADNLCEVIATAKANGDFATELVASKTSLLWKYKGVMGYKDCLGL